MYTFKLCPAIQYYSATLCSFLLVLGSPTAFRPSHTPARFRNASAALSVWLRHIAFATLGGGLVNRQVDRTSFCMFKLLRVAYIVVLYHHFNCNRLIVSVVARALYFHD